MKLFKIRLMMMVERQRSMKIQSLLLSAILLSPLQAYSGEYQHGYSSERSWFKNEYREEYVPGTRSSPGYIRSFEETVEVPCNQNRLSTAPHQYHPENRYYQKNNRIHSHQITIEQVQQMALVILQAQ